MAKEYEHLTIEIKMEISKKNTNSIYSNDSAILASEVIKKTFSSLELRCARDKAVHIIDDMKVNLVDQLNNLMLKDKNAELEGANIS